MHLPQWGMVHANMATPHAEGPTMSSAAQQAPACSLIAAHYDHMRVAGLHNTVALIGSVF